MLVIENKYIVQNNSKKAYFIYLCTNINNTNKNKDIWKNCFENKYRSKGSNK